MKTVKIVSLALNNFKGIKKRKFTFKGSDADIRGDNATGKTMVYDAYLWLMCDKNSTNIKDFNIKPFDPCTGEPYHGLDHSVELVILVDDVEVVLTRVYREKWEKERGSTERLFSGHDNKYWVDGVPTSTKKEFDAKVENIIPAEVFKLLSNPHYFNDYLEWQKRRGYLFSVSGINVTDADIIASSEKLASLSDIMAGYSRPEDYRKVIKEKIKNINVEIEKLPIRIDEVIRNAPVILSQNEYDVLEFEKKQSLEEIAAIEKEEVKVAKLLNDIVAASRAKLVEASDLEAKIIELEKLMNSTYDTQFSAQSQKVTMLSRKYDDLKENLGSLGIKVSSLNLEIQMINTRLEVNPSPFGRHFSKSSNPKVDTLVELWYANIALLIPRIGQR